MIPAMNYAEGTQYMRALCSRGRGQLEPYPGILIEYPGKKKPGDYRMTIAGKGAPRHEAICQWLYRVAQASPQWYGATVFLLSSVYDEGTKAPLYGPQTHAVLRDLQHHIYWITLQEDINYPMERGCAGRRMPFCRYFEAIYCTQTNAFCLEDVLTRCYNHGGARPALYSIPNPPHFYW